MHFKTMPPFVVESTPQTSGSSLWVVRRILRNAREKLKTFLSKSLWFSTSPSSETYTWVVWFPQIISPFLIKSIWLSLRNQAPSMWPTRFGMISVRIRIPFSRWRKFSSVRPSLLFLTWRTWAIPSACSVLLHHWPFVVSESVYML